MFPLAICSLYGLTEKTIPRKCLNGLAGLNNFGGCAKKTNTNKASLVIVVGRAKMIFLSFMITHYNALIEWRNKMKKAMMILMVSMAFASCTSARISANLTSGAIGCRPGDIIIENETASVIGGLHNWEAICNGKRYICSYQVTTGVNCKEMIELASVPLQLPYPQPPSSTSNVTKRDGIYVVYANGVVKDTRSGLDWFVGPDRGTDWNQARSWVQSLNVDGDIWRMPTTDELETLYKKRAGSRNMTPLLKTTGWWVWSGETKGSSMSRVRCFDFGNGYWNWVYRNYYDGRAFAVRSEKR